MIIDQSTKAFVEDGTVPAWKRQRFERGLPLCETCEHHYKSIQLAGNVWTREMCKERLMEGIPEEGYCDLHQHRNSLWPDANLRALMKATEFITEKEFSI